MGSKNVWLRQFAGKKGLDSEKIQVARKIKGRKGWVLKMFAVQKDFLVPTIRTNAAWTNVTRMVKSRRIK